MASNPLDDNDPERDQRIRERAYHLWEADGCPHGREAEFWERATELIGIEESPHAGELPNPATQPGADPYRTQPVEEAFLEANLGDPTDKGERISTPSRANLVSE
jgi:hypothetical protein